MGERYNIYYSKYSPFARDYIQYVKVVYTHNIYHEVGKLVCTSIEDIKSISYTKPNSSVEDCEKYWLENGYKKLCSNLWSYNPNANMEGVDEDE